MTKEFENEIIEFIKDTAENYDTIDICGCDVAMYLTEDINNLGYYFLDEEKNKNFIRHYFEDAGETFNYFRDNFDMIINPFDNPSTFVVYMIIYGVETFVNNSDYIYENWDKIFTLAPNVVKEIIGDN